MTRDAINSIIPLVALMIFGAATVFFAIVSVIMHYHWAKYTAGINTKRLGIIRALYLLVSLLLIFAMSWGLLSLFGYKL